MRRSTAALRLLLLLAVATLFRSSDGNTIRRSSSFVAPTRGSARSLVLTTYVTDAADLHYAAVLSGFAPLDAAAIKDAAQPTATTPSEDGSSTNDPASAERRDGIVQASTVAVRRAQKLERLLDGLQANTSYDVYFVAEVPNSNGVFGTVLSVMGTATHPVYPDVVAMVAAAANASATSVAVNITLASPGLIHLAFVPSSPGDAGTLTAENVVARKDHGMGVIFTTERRFRWDSLSVQTIVEGLASATEYEMLVVSEAPGHGAVFSELIRQERAVQTHASAPDVVDVSCLPTKASSSSVDINFRLQFSPEELGRATPSTVQRYQYDVTYEVPKETTNGTSMGSHRGSFAVEGFESVDDLARDTANLALQRSIDGLGPDARHDISLRVETRNSHGVVSKSERIQNCRTHATAPKILKANVQPTNGTVHALRVDVELTHSGNVHYVLAPRSASTQLRNSLSRLKSVEEIVRVIQDSANAQQYRTGIFETTEVISNASAAVKTFLVEELEDNTPYSIAVIPETIGSFGVFGGPFGELLEASTNENASEVSVIAAQPTYGSATSIDVRVSMTKPADILFACWRKYDDEEVCHEVPRDELERTSQSPQASSFLYRMGNLTEATKYEVSLFAESHLRNGVRSERTSRMAVATPHQAPKIGTMDAHAVDARVDAIRLHIEISEPGYVHYVIVEDHFDEGNGKEVNASRAEPLPVEAIVDETIRANNAMGDHAQHGSRHDAPGRLSRDAHRSNRAHPSQADPASHSTSKNAVKRGQALVSSTDVILTIAELQSNISYSIHAVTETSLEGGDGTVVPSGVYGPPMRVRTTTHDVAPVIVRAVADATSGRTDSIVVTVNVSRPGIVHYQLTDTDFADPITIKGTPLGAVVDPHVLRGSSVIEFKDMGIQIKNGTNDTEPMEPMVFANNFTIDSLREATTYYLSLTTETSASNGVFGGFPAPILVRTHDLPPHFEPGSLFIGPVAGSSTELAIQFRLDKLGEVHYAVFFRGIVRDRTTDAFEEQEQWRLGEQEIAAEAHTRMNENKNSTEKTKEFVKVPRWPPPASTYDLSRLTPRAVKDALFEELEEGVWENGTIAVSRDDVFKMKVTEKKVQKLPPNAVFDVCLAPETSASDGIFAPLACHRVHTHADYSNQSMAFDEVLVSPVAGTKDAVRVELTISKLLEGAGEDAGEDVDSKANIHRLELATGRVPYFILIDGHDGRPELSHNPVGPSTHHHRHDRTISPFMTAAPGRGNVVAAGVLDAITFENDTFIVVERTVAGLRDNHRYYFFFAYETAHGSGVFTKVNPHKHRPNETNARNPEVQAIEVTTFEEAPRMKSYEAIATYGNTSSITAIIDVACVSREEVILHLLVVNDGCPALSPHTLLPSSGELVTVETIELEDADRCDHPLLYRRVEVNMTERSSASHHHHHHRHHRAGEPKRSSIEEVIVSDGVLLPNTTYHVLMATETYNSSGVVSEKFEIARVTTLPLAPRINKLQVQPRKGSTTELMLIVELEYPGEVHYMLGKSGNPELNVTSPYNVSAKSLPGQRDTKFHDYGRDVVRQRRSIQVEHARRTHVEVIDYLVAGTSYDVYVVVETADSSGVYGEVLSFLSVSTFATPPMLLAHTAFPTPGSTDSLSVGFRAEEGIPCLVHISVATSSPWALTARVAWGSDAFGNRLAMNDRFVGHTSFAVDGKDTSGDNGWHEVNVSVPLPGTNYTVFLVTETTDSDGVFGTVATHYGVRSHREPPVPLNVSVRPTDARVDALTVDIVLNHDEGAHIHFAALRHRQRFTRSAITAVGRVNVVGSNATSFIVDGLQGRATYDVYLRLETFESGGVIGEWASFPITAATHGMPAEVLESVECETSPACAAMGRHPCSHTANVCGECLDGFDGVTGSSNTACTPLESGKMGPTIKISGVRINPKRRRPRQDEPDELSVPTEPSVPSSDAELESAMDVTKATRDAGSTVANTKEVAAAGQCEREPGYRADNFGSFCLASYENPLLAQSVAWNDASRAL